jgi:hypothetical protein
MLPHEKELVELYKDQPFALIGVNSDQPNDIDKAPAADRFETCRLHVKKLLDEGGITWRNAIDLGTDGPWASKWNVSGWPTLYVLDPQGTIQYKGHDGEKMTKAIEELLASAKKD